MNARKQVQRSTGKNTVGKIVWQHARRLGLGLIVCFACLCEPVVARYDLSKCQTSVSHTIL